MIEQGSVQSYALGFIVSLLLTLGAYFLASGELPRLAIELSVAGISILQAWVFLFLYLGLGRESKPRWSVMVFLFMLLVTILLLAGSIWIMHHLNYNLRLNE